MEIKHSDESLHAKNNAPITFHVTDPEKGPVEVLRFEPNGDCYVRGEKVDTNQEVYQAVCKWLSSAGFMPTPA